MAGWFRGTADLPTDFMNCFRAWDGHSEHVVSTMAQYLWIQKHTHLPWRMVLNNHTTVPGRHRGPPPLDSIAAVMTAEKERHDWWLVRMALPNSFQGGDGLRLSVAACGGTREEAVDHCCWLAVALLLLRTVEFHDYRLIQKHWRVEVGHIWGKAQELRGNATRRALAEEAAFLPLPPPSAGRSRLYEAPNAGSEAERLEEVREVLWEMLRRLGNAEWACPSHPPGKDLGLQLGRLVEPGKLFEFLQADDDFEVWWQRGAKTWFFRAAPSLKTQPGVSAGPRTGESEVGKKPSELAPPPGLEEPTQAGVSAGEPEVGEKTSEQVLRAAGLLVRSGSWSDGGRWKVHAAESKGEMASKNEELHVVHEQKVVPAQQVQQSFYSTEGKAMDARRGRRARVEDRCSQQLGGDRLRNEVVTGCGHFQ